jgi:hypothetical protein
MRSRRLLGSRFPRLAIFHPINVLESVELIQHFAFLTPPGVHRRFVKDRLPILLRHHHRPAVTAYSSSCVGLGMCAQDASSNPLRPTPKVMMRTLMRRILPNRPAQKSRRLFPSPGNPGEG